ncbi:GUN4 domain-containing protein [Leptolyngbya iicbica]|uniref:GUN4-like domain-containing protein n=2 Tax=Cyanophyceae TaxID=3028117 RepID=A0A4Q7EG39_9CYAN|nr:GUN4 domain-containing protein [Leptolyngbya sp. LK]RZM82047.1 hypothetical protein DYY88_01925 [Leptolyngbya sp. LK]
MERILLAVLITGLAIAGEPIHGRAQSPSPDLSPANPRYDIYLNYPDGLRFIYPAGYQVDGATQYTPPSPEAALQVSLDLWKVADYSPFGMMYNATAPTEPPPHISIDIWQNPAGRPLSDWMELATAPGTVTTVAGQGAIAYTATGLYESDVVLFTQANGDVVKLQVEYSDANDPMRQHFQTVVESLTFDTTTSAVIEVDYRRLQDTLRDGDWQAANLETIAILMRLASSYDYTYPHIETDDIADLPCADLQTINTLWSRYSEGRYGLTAQQAIWRSLPTSDPSQRAEQYGDQLGWRLTEPPTADFLSNSLWRSDTELLYTAVAPVGQFPWPGVPSLTTDRMLQNSGPACGSCSVDAMYIQSDRWPDFLNAFMTRVDDCLCAGDTTAPKTL